MCVECASDHLVHTLPPPDSLHTLPHAPRLTCPSLLPSGTRCADSLPPHATTSLLASSGHRRLALALAAASLRPTLAALAKTESTALGSCPLCHTQWLLAVPPDAPSCPSFCPGCGVGVDVSSSPANPGDPGRDDSVMGVLRQSLSRLWIWAYTRSCPCCGIPITRSIGCRYVQCSVCGTEICYACGDEFHPVKTTWCWEGLDTPWHEDIRTYASLGGSLLALHAAFGAGSATAQGTRALLPYLGITPPLPPLIAPPPQPFAPLPPLRSSASILAIFAHRLRNAIRAQARIVTAPSRYLTHLFRTLFISCFSLASTLLIAPPHLHHPYPSLLLAFLPTLSI